MAVYRVTRTRSTDGSISGYEDNIDRWQYIGLRGQDRPMAVYRVTRTRSTYGSISGYEDNIDLCMRNVYVILFILYFPCNFFHIFDFPEGGGEGGRGGGGLGPIWATFGVLNAPGNTDLTQSVHKRLQFAQDNVFTCLITILRNR